MIALANQISVMQTTHMIFIFNLAIRGISINVAQKAIRNCIFLLFNYLFCMQQLTFNYMLSLPKVDKLHLEKIKIQQKHETANHLIFKERFSISDADDFEL